MLKKKSYWKINITIFAILSLLGIYCSLLFEVNFLVSMFLSYFVPSLFLSILCPKKIKKIFVWSLLFTAPLTIILDYLSVVSGAWNISESIFSVRLFDVVAIEQFFWSFFTIYEITFFYEIFFNKKKKERCVKKNERGSLKKIANFYFEAVVFLGILVSVLFVFFLLLKVQPELLKIDNFFFYWGFFLILIPAVTFYSKFPSLLKRALAVTSLFVLIFASAEYVSLKLDYWTYGDGNVFMVPFFDYKIPFEEYFFYFFLSVSAMIAYYEFFCDDRK